MEDLFLCFAKVDRAALLSDARENCLGQRIVCYQDINPSALEHFKIAIIGVPEGRSDQKNSRCAEAPDQVRKYLYGLSNGATSHNIIDMGNIISGKTVKDTHVITADVLCELITRGIFPILIGGSQDLTYANYCAYAKLEKIVNLAIIDSKIDILHENANISPDSYLNHIILHKPSVLFNMVNIGSQACFVEKEQEELMNRLYFETERLGIVRKDLMCVEPALRRADMLSIDISAVRHGDAPGNSNASPNGFYGEEICQLMHYAGMSTSLTSLGIYEINPSLDITGKTSFLAAQMIWYFIQSFNFRVLEDPEEDSAEFIKYHVAIPELESDISFFKSKQTDRWWMQVNSLEAEEGERLLSYIIPCSYVDYQQALNGEIPKRWWFTFKKL